MIPFQFNDGGRAAAGFKGLTGDCVARSVAIATNRPYKEVYAELADINAGMSKTKRRKHLRVGVSTASHGIYTRSKAYKDYMTLNGFVWTPTMQIGSGCKVHLRADELPMGRLVVALSKHSAAVIDGVLMDNHDSSRDGTRCVYGYWTLTK